MLSYWVGHLKALPEDPHWLRHMGLDKGALEDLIGELITGADRSGLDQALIGLIDSAESQTAAMRSQLAERQVYVTATRINRFVDYLGSDNLPPDDRPRSLVGQQRPVFAPPPPIPPRSMPVLPATPVNFPALYIVDWFEAFRALAIANAGHAAGRDISPEQNARLGQILDRVAGKAPDPQRP
ncbi:Virulence factor [Thiocapsa sp. KS1]|nr:virulence factor SrfC family protein [Thiocapsa sp. KS1]CRI67671.1 Virulence factor [Thiocapsa sp. KS1]